MPDAFSKSASSGDTVSMRQNHQRKKAIFATTLPLLLHAFFVATTVCFLSIYLNGRNFGIHHRDRFDDVTPQQGLNKDAKMSLFEHWSPLQADMITTLSVLLVTTRFFLTLLCTDIAWKYLFILLEQTGLSVSQMGGLIKYKVLLKSGLPEESLPRGVGLHHFLVALVLFLLFPAQFSSPLISGSITWIPTHDHVPGTPLSVIAAFTNGMGWESYQKYPGFRDNVVNGAGNIHNWFYNSPSDTSLKRDLHNAINRQLAPNSTITNITMPFISLSNLAWMTNISVISPSELEAIDSRFRQLGIAGATTSLFTSGGPVLIPPRPWAPAKKNINQTAFVFEDPPAETISQQLYIVLAPRMVDLRNTSATCDQPIGWRDISIPPSTAWYIGKQGMCYMFATVDVVAGAKTCRDCPIMNSQLTSVDESRLAGTPLEPDRLMNEILAFMPESMGNILTSATQYHSPDKSDLDNYVQSITKRAYVASWNSLAKELARGANDSSNIKIGVESTRALVSFWRVYAWIAFQALAWVAAGIFAHVQRHCKRPLTTDTVMAALFLDHDDQLQEEVRASGLSNVVTISSKRHNKRLGVLKLKFDSNDEHSYLTQWRPEKQG